MGEAQSRLSLVITGAVPLLGEPPRCRDERAGHGAASAQAAPRSLVGGRAEAGWEAVGCRELLDVEQEVSD
jgi:hypothetical protein